MLHIFADSEAGFVKFIKEIDWIAIQRLSLNHDLSEFCCGDTAQDMDLNAFVKEDALKQQEERSNVTHVAVLKDTNKVIGFATVLSDRLKVSTAEKKEMGIASRYCEFPALKIGRLAVDKNYHGRKVGTNLLRFVKGLALESGEQVGIRFLIVDSYPKSVDWYLRKGFVRNQIQGQNAKILKEKQNGTAVPKLGYQRETVSLRMDLFNPKE